MDYYNALLSVIIVVVIIMILYTTFADYQVERFFPITNEPVTKGGELNIDVDDLEFNESGNISLSRDIDLLQQRKIGMKFDHPHIPDMSGMIDNSDVVDQVVSRGDTIFQPSHSIGVSATTTAGMGKFALAGPSGLPFFDDQTVYDSPTNGQFSIDEKMSIAQQHRGSIAQKAIEGYVRSTKNLYKKYFLNELDENSNREWWDDSASEGLETDFGPDIDIY